MKDKLKRIIRLSIACIGYFTITTVAVFILELIFKYYILVIWNIIP